MSTEVETVLIRLQREIGRAQKLVDADPHLDWQAYLMMKNALLAMLPLLPSDVVSQVRELVKLVSVSYQRSAEVRYLRSQEGQYEQ